MDRDPYRQEEKGTYHYVNGDYVWVLERLTIFNEIVF